MCNTNEYCYSCDKFDSSCNCLSGDCSALPDDLSCCNNAFDSTCTLCESSRRRLEQTS